MMSGMSVQLDWINNSRCDEIETRINDLWKRVENIRRGLFARHNEFEKRLTIIEDRLEKIERDMAMILEFVSSFQMKCTA